MARLAASFANSDTPTSTTQLERRLKEYLTRTIPLSESKKAAFSQYLESKPGSPRYSRWRREIGVGHVPEVELQDLWLSESSRSSVGSLSKNYYSDPIALAQLLGLLKSNNALLPRGKLCRLELGSPKVSPFELDQRQSLLLALWLLANDGDWLWAFLLEMQSPTFSEITVANRIKLLLNSIDRVLDARHLRSGSSDYLSTRSRLLELKSITVRNRDRDGLNLGQPWSWFLVPRLELLVDARILDKNQPGQLTGYTLSSAGRVLSQRVTPEILSQDILKFFISAFFPGRKISPPSWRSVEEYIQLFSSSLSSSAGYFPLYETAGAICVHHALNQTVELWEISSVQEMVKEMGTGSGSRLTLGIDRLGYIYNFRFCR